jgi:hypothetical protein
MTVEGNQQFKHDVRHCAELGRNGRNGLQLTMDKHSQLTVDEVCCQRIMNYYYTTCLCFTFGPEISDLDSYRFSLCCKIVTTTRPLLVCVLRCHSLGVMSKEIQVPVHKDIMTNCSHYLKAIQEILPTLQSWCRNWVGHCKACLDYDEALPEWFMTPFE